MNARVSQLENGIRLVSHEMPWVESVSFGVWIEIGARHEPENLNGISHFLEHMAFKGTKKRTALDLAEEIENVGGLINAYTSRENTAYYVKVLKEDLDLGIDVISDILQNSTMDEQEIERERTVILQEISQANDTPDDIVFDIFQQTAFPDQAIGRPVLGDVQRVKSISRDDILTYMKDNYATSRLVVSAAGNLNHDDLVQKIERAFVDFAREPRVKADPTLYRAGYHLENRPGLDQLQVLIGFEGLPYSDPDFYTASIQTTLFGGGMSSRLFQEIREKRGLVYTVSSYLSSYDDGGLYSIYAGCAPDDIAELLPAIGEEARKVCTNVTQAELDRARAQLKANILMSLESTSARCEQLARQMVVFGRPIELDEIVEEIEKVTPEDIQKVSHKIFSGPATLTCLGPTASVPDEAAFKAAFAIS